MECWKESLRGFNLALMFAELNEDFGQAYYNRARIFLKLHKFNLAEKDYELSQKYCPGINLGQELSLLKSKSMKYMNTTNFIRENLDELIGSKYFSVVKSNPKIEYAGNFVRIEETIERGRCLIAAKNINAGEVILAQKPFAVVLKDLLVWDTQHCHFCYKPIKAGFPCNQCTFAIYCSQECLTKSQSSFHQHEHNYFPYLNAIKSPRRDLMAAQIILNLGPSFLYNLFENWKSFPQSSFDSNGIYKSSTYPPIYHLVSHANQLKPIEKISNGFRSLILLHLIDDKTNFFEQFYEELKPSVLDQFKDFVASLILHHIEIIPYNVISMSELVHENGNDAISYGMGLFSLLCLANHSCDPNAIPLRRPNSTKVSLIALKSMKPGDEIFISYSPLYTTMSTVERKEFLSKRYNFVCNCIPCTNNWFMDLDKEILKLRNTEAYNSSRSLRSKKSELQRIYENLIEIESMILNRKFHKALDTLNPFLNTLTQNYTSRFPLTLFAQELMKKSLVGLVNQK